MANPEHLAKLHEGVNAWNQWRKQNPDIKIDLSHSNLRLAKLDLANLTAADLREVNLSRAALTLANLDHADVRAAKLTNARLDGAILNGANLSRADCYGAICARASFQAANLEGATFTAANLLGADLSRANLQRALADSANLAATNLIGTDLRGTDLRSTKLQNAKLDEANATDARLWETQRSSWSIKNVTCERAFWDKDGKVATTYGPGMFERIHSEQTSIELFYEGGISKFELDTLPALLHHLASSNPNSSIRLKSFEEDGGGAKISISLTGADVAVVDRIRAEAFKVYQSQLALRDREVERLRIEKETVQTMSERLISAMLQAAAPRNIVVEHSSGVVISDGGAHVTVHQSIGDNSQVLALLEKMLSHRAEFGLAIPDASQLEGELNNVKKEAQKPAPDKTLIAKSLTVIQKIMSEAAMKAAGKLGESMIVDWQGWLHQINQVMQNFR
jgi:uncharacterized protein YjbI with pentapeptide repeats